MSGDGEWHTDRPVVGGRYTQTRQRWLKVKTIKSGHGRHCKEALAVYRNHNNSKYYSIENLKSKK